MAERNAATSGEERVEKPAPAADSAQANERMAADSEPTAGQTTARATEQPTAAERGLPALEIASTPQQSNQFERLTPETLNQTVKKLNEALGREQYWFDPRGGDFQAVKEILERFSPEDRRQIVNRFERTHGVKFDDVAKSELGTENARRVNVILNTNRDGTSFEGIRFRLDQITGTGQALEPSFLRTAVTMTSPGGSLFNSYNQTELAKTQAANVRELRQHIGLLNSSQLKALNDTSVAQTGKTLAQHFQDNKYLSANDKAAMQILVTTGTDKITPQQRAQLAGLAVQGRDLDMLREALGGSPEARRLFQQQDGERKIKTAFPNSLDQQRALDYLKSGEETIATQVRASEGWLWGTDKATVEASINALDPHERERYLRGMELSRTPGRQDLNPQDKEALDYFKQTNQSLDSHFDKRDAARFKAMIAYGKDSFIPQAIETYSSGFIGIGAGHDDARLNRLIDGLSPTEFQRLRNDQNYRTQVKEALGTFLPQNDLNRTMEYINRKIGATQPEFTYDQSKLVGRPLEQVIDQNKGSGFFSPANKPNIIGAIANMSPEDAAKYQSNPEFRTRIQQSVRSALGEGPHLQLANDLLRNVERTGKVELSAYDKLRVGNFTGAKLPETVRNLETLFQQDPSALERVRNPQNDADRKFKQNIENALSSALFESPAIKATMQLGGNPMPAHNMMFRQYSESLLRTGRLDLPTRLSIAETGQERMAAVMGAPESVRAQLLEQNPSDSATRQLQQRVFQGFSPEQQEVLRNGLRQGRMEPVDTVRSMVLDSSAKPEQLKEFLNGLTKEQRSELQNTYSQKYKQDLTANVLDKVPADQRASFQELLRHYDRGDVEHLNDLQQQRRTNESGLLGNLRFGGEVVSADAMNDYLESARRASSDFSSLSREEQARLVGDANSTLERWSNERRETANTVTDSVIVVGALTATIATGGGASPLLIAAVGTAGAAVKVGGNELLLGDQYGNSARELLADGTGGFVTAAGAFIGPQQLGAVLGVGRRLAGEATTGIVTTLGSGALREGGEAALNRGLTTLYRDAIVNGSSGISEASVKALAKQVAVQGQEEAVEQAIRTTLANTKPSSINKFMNEVMLNSVAGGTATGAGEGAIQAVKWDPNLSAAENVARIASATRDGTVTGLLAGAGGTVLLRAGGTAVRQVRQQVDNLRAPSNTGAPAARLADEVPTARPRTEDAHTPRTDDATPPRTDDGTTPPRTDDGSPQNDRTREQPLERVSGDAPVRPPEIMTPQRLREFSENIASRFTNQPVTREQFADLFRGDYNIGGVTRKLTQEEQAVVREILERSGPNMSSPALNARMMAVRDAAEQIPGWQWRNPATQGGPEVGVVYVLDGSTDGNALAHLFKTNTGLDVNIRVLNGDELRVLTQAQRTIDDRLNQIRQLQERFPNGMDQVQPGFKKTPTELVDQYQAEIKKLRQEHKLDNAIFFDNINNATPEQRRVLGSVQNLVVADMDGFTRGPNIYDLSSAGMSGDNGVVKDKIGSLLEQVNRIKAETGATTGDAVNQALRGQYADQVTAAMPNARVVNTDAVTPGRAARDVTAETADRINAPDYVSDSLYRQMFQPQATPEQIERFIGQLSAEQQVIATRLLRDATEVNTYGDMMRQARQLHQNILESVPGKDPKNMLIITGMEDGKGGSSYLVNHLYSRVNGLTPENFVSLNDLRAIAKLKEGAPIPEHLKPLYESLKTKRLVFIDDYAMGGTQVPNILNQQYSQVFERLQGRMARDGSPLEGITVGTLGRHQLPSNIPDPWNNSRAYPNLFPRADGRPHLNVTVAESPARYQALNVENSAFFNSLTPEQQITFTQMMQNSTYRGSDVRSALILPYGGPNNNIPWIQAFIESGQGLGLPARYRNRDWTPIIREGME